MKVQKKYRLDKTDKIKTDGKTLYRIVALRDFGDVKTGDRGGYIQKNSNLSHEGNCWIYDESCVWDDARIIIDAKVREAASVCNEAVVSGGADVYGSSLVYDRARVGGRAHVAGDASVCGEASVSDWACVFSDALVCGSARVYGSVRLTQGADVRRTSHWLCLGPIGSRRTMLSVFRTMAHGICVTTGGFEGTPEDLLMEKNKVHHGKNRKYYREYSAAIKLVKEWAKQWEEENL
jgi:carbonic anhydrase/acetyltransferase-like protein (isoleucine patch superfamily)